MKIQRFGNNEFAIGLNWRIIRKNERKQINRIAKDAGSDYAARFDAGDLIALGFTDGSRAKCASGASVLKMVAKDSDRRSIGVIEAVGNGPGGAALYWMCAVDADGIPLPGCDVIAEEADIINLANNTFSGGEFDVYSKTTLYPGVTDKSFAEIAEGVKIKPDIKTVRTSAFIVPLMLIVIIGGAAAWYLVSNQLEIRDKNLKLAAQKAQRLLSEKQAIEEEQKKFEEAYRLALDGFSKAVSKPSSKSMILEWVDAADSIPIMVRGWKLMSVSCTPDACIGNYERKLGTVNDMLQAGEKYGVVSIEPQNKASILTSLKALPSRGGSLDNLPAANPFFYDFMSGLQKNSAGGMTFAMQDPAKPAPMKAPDGTLRTIPYAKGAFKIEGKYAFEFMEMARILNQSNVIVENFTLGYGSLPDSMPWAMEGYYVVK